MTAQPADVPHPPATLGTFNTRERVVLTFASILCGVILVWVSRLSGTPAEPGFAGSILRETSGFIGLIVLGVTLVGCAILASAFVGRVRHEAGLFCACVGLAFVSIRAGTVRYALQDAGGPSVFIVLALETLILFLFLGAGAFVLHRLARRGIVTTDAPIDDEPDAPLTSKILATLTSAGLIVILTSLLAQSDDKGQVLASVLVASIIGAIGGHALFPVRGAVWFYAAPLVAALVGYGIGMNSSSPAVFMTGLAPTNFTRALPLDFASVGTAGAIFGYWTARRWKYAEDDETLDSDAPTQAA